MLLLLLAAASLQQQPVPTRTSTTTSIAIGVDSKTGATVNMTSRQYRDTTRRDSLRARRKLVVATSADLASAFADAGARTLLARARVARTEQDSSLASYDASTVQRLTLGLAFTKIGRERIFFRHELASRVQWARGVGAQIDITGKRTAVPMLGGTSKVDIESILSPVPYYPGRDALLMGLARAKPNAREDDLIHPLANSAEAFYTYRTGDSVTFRLPDNTTIQLRELEVRPRKPDWHTVIGSLWFDTATGQLVRAAYRLSTSVDLLAGDSTDQSGFMARAILRPSTATIAGVAVEYGLYQGKFWLPRSQVAEGSVQAGFVRMPMRIEEHFTYAGVNGRDSVATIPPPPELPIRVRKAGDQKRLDSAFAAARTAECASRGEYTMSLMRYGGTLPVQVHVPCDSLALAHSPALPKSIFDSGEAVFGDTERDALLAKAESMMLDLAFVPQMPHVTWGLDLLRYNRVEGLSSAIDVTQALGSGYALRFSPRIGTADRIPNAELSLSRTNGAGTVAATGYRRLSVANDWGHPLDFGSGLSAFLFGRDEGLYYRTSGAEATGDKLFGASWQWRVFTERQSDAIARTNVSIPRVLGSAGFDPRGNIVAQRARETGASLRNVSSFGLDPNGFRLLSDVRLEAASGGYDYGRGALDLTLSHPIGRMLSRDFSSAITVGGGTSVGEIPVQRLWYIGGTNTVRGQAAAAQIGDSYWLTRSEIGYGSTGMRRIVFLDLGWAGDRTKWREVGRPASGVGLGFSFLDGLIRADVARGIYPEHNWRSALYLEAKF